MTDDLPRAVGHPDAPPELRLHDLAEEVEAVRETVADCATVRVAYRTSGEPRIIVSYPDSEEVVNNGQ